MTTQQNRPRLPDIKFRVLIIGRANAGKTTILQRVCDTTESPEIYRLDAEGTRHQVKLGPTMERGQHNIDDELIFTNHKGYIFHDSRGFESGSEDELRIVQEFVKRKSQTNRLKDRLHAIWYCIPTDNNRPSLELKYFEEICPDKNVPVIAVFTKFDQFRRNIRMKLEDEGCDQEMDLDAEVKIIFNQRYLAGLNGPPPFVCLEKMQRREQRCANLIEMTADALSGDAVALMLLAVQKDNLELSIKQAIKRTHRDFEEGGGTAEKVIKSCAIAFPSLWFWLLNLELLNLELLLDLRSLSLSNLNSSNGKLLFSKLLSFIPNSHLCISSDDIHHIMIVTILILDFASLLYASPSRPTLDNALDQASSQYESSDTHNAVKEQFSLPPKRYSVSQFTEFILSHRLR